MREIFYYNGVEYDKEAYLQTFTKEERIDNAFETKHYYLYTKDDLETMGLPDTTGKNYLEFNGKRYEMYEGFYGDNFGVKPWYGKVAFIRDGNSVNLIDLENGEITFFARYAWFDDDFFIRPISKDLFIKSCQGKDVADFREYIVTKNGKTLDRIDGTYQVNYTKDGKFSIDKFEGRGYTNLVGTISEEDLTKRLKIFEANENLINSLKTMAELGVSKETIDNLVNSVYENENTNEFKN